MEHKPHVELVGYTCGECGGHEWHVKIGHANCGRTFLYLMCADQDCVKAKQIEHGVTDASTLIWDEFDITGQGQDPQDIGGLTGQGHLN